MIGGMGDYEVNNPPVPTEVNGTVWVPLTTEVTGVTQTTYLPQERLLEMHDAQEDNDRLGTDDFRFDS